MSNNVGRAIIMLKNYSLKGYNIRLESFRDEFITAEYLSWLKDDEVNRYLIKPTKDTTLVEAKKYCQDLMESKNDYFFALIVNRNNKHIGNVRVGPIKNPDRVCKYSMMIGDKKYHGRGFGNEAVKLSIDFCFRTMKMHKLCLDVVEENIPAIKLYEKNNFATEGILKDQIFLGGKYYDLRIMGLMNPHENQGTVSGCTSR